MDNIKSKMHICVSAFETLRFTLVLEQGFIPDIEYQDAYYFGLCVWGGGRGIVDARAGATNINITTFEFAYVHTLWEEQTILN